MICCNFNGVRSVSLFLHFHHHHHHHRQYSGSTTTTSKTNFLWCFSQIDPTLFLVLTNTHAVRRLCRRKKSFLVQRMGRYTLVHLDIFLIWLPSWATNYGRKEGYAVECEKVWNVDLDDTKVKVISWHFNVKVHNLFYFVVARFQLHKRKQTQVNVLRIRTELNIRMANPKVFALHNRFSFFFQIIWRAVSSVFIRKSI